MSRIIRIDHNNLTIIRKSSALLNIFTLKEVNKFMDKREIQKGVDMVYTFAPEFACDSREMIRRIIRREPNMSSLGGLIGVASLGLERIGLDSEEAAEFLALAIENIEKHAVKSATSGK